MTREEQIEKQLWYIASHPNCPEHTASKSVGVNYFGLGFKYGALWADQNPQSPWISVKDRLPEEGKPCLVAYIGHSSEETSIIAYYINGDWEDREHYRTYPDYWMPIPELPKEEQR